MIRYGTAILIAAGACVATGVAACGDDSVGGPPMTATGGSGNNTGGGGNNTGGSGDTSGGGAAGMAPASKGCEGECCPSDATCYSSSAGKTAPGAECMARIQNTPKHIQLRQTWIDLLAPAGNTIPIVLKTLNTYTQFKEPACNTPDGASGYMQAVDLDLEAGVSTVGYVKYTTPSTALSDGVCYVDIGTGVDSANPDNGWHDVADYAMEKNFDFALPADKMSSTKDWPPGLPAPMPQPWKVTPTKAKQLTADFDLSKERADLIKKLAPDGELGKDGFSGVFYYDDKTGTSHGYSPLSYNIIYDAPSTAGANPTTMIVTPIREAELKYRVNDPAAPNCVGKYLASALEPATGCVDPGMTGSGADAKNAWGGIFNMNKGEGDAGVLGYFLITELEQIYSRVLGMTLCVSYPTLDKSIMDGWATMTEKRCRMSSKWDPTKPDNAGLPNGDWCAATNSKATATCHDAYQSKSFHAFQAFKIKKDHCTPF
jgi:hypothetical protein